MRTAALVLMILFLTYAAGCSGEASDAPAGHRNASLTDQDIQLFLEVYPAYLKWASAQEKPVTDDQAKRFLSSQGVDPARLQWIMERVMLGYMAISLEQELPLLEKRIADMDRTRQRLLRDGAIDEKQKESIHREFDELIREQQEMVKKMRAFSENERELLLAHEQEVGAVLHEALAKKQDAEQ